MPVQRFALADARLQRSPGQDADIFAANMVDGQDGSPVSVGFGRYGPDQSLTETLAVDDVMVVLEGRLSITAGGATPIAGPGEVVHMPKGETVTIRAHAEGAVTAFVTYPHWEEAER